jgi:hypothetical protein
LSYDVKLVYLKIYRAFLSRRRVRHASREIVVQIPPGNLWAVDHVAHNSEAVMIARLSRFPGQRFQQTLDMLNRNIHQQMESGRKS